MATIANLLPHFRTQKLTIVGSARTEEVTFVAIQAASQAVAPVRRFSVSSLPA